MENCLSHVPCSAKASVVSFTPQERIDQLRAAFPEQGLFQDKEWVLSPESFRLEPDTVDLIQRLGPALRRFQRACNDLYLASAEGEAPPWVARLLDRGKPEHLIQLGRQARFRDELPGVLRPDLILTEDGVKISELDSIPGGIGLTAWLNETYAAMGDPVIGGASGMVEGFADAFPDEDILISRESADYQPEMEWLADRLRSLHGAPPRHVMNPWNLTPPELTGTALYRFFELFDLDNVELSSEILRGAEAGELTVTPPLKAFMEEKLWLALFWSPQLQDRWSSRLGEADVELLQRCIPRGWVVDPEPLPPFAVYPGLNISSWDELRTFGGKDRQLVLKISGFSERGWGSRGVFIGHDLSQDQWSAAIDEALTHFERHPYVLQEFHRARVVTHPAWDAEAGVVTHPKSRVRLCPYYFATDAEKDEVTLGGVLATVCPADKKILHGMRDAMMLPCVVR